MLFQRSAALGISQRGQHNESIFSVGGRAQQAQQAQAQAQLRKQPLFLRREATRGQDDASIVWPR
jgi:hypothetical protein